MRILIVDDSRAMRMIVMRTLRQAGFGGHQIEQASNGQEALDAVAASGVPDLVLADWNMPEKSGLQLLQELRASHPDTRLGFVTSEGSAGIKETAMENGALFVISKPFTADVFRSTLGPLVS